MKNLFLAVAMSTALSLGMAANATPVDAPLSPGEHDVVIDGTRIHYEVAGRGPLLIVQAPGWGIGSGYLRKGLKPLEATRTVVTYDPRNSGKSVRVAAPQRLNTSDMADDLEHLRAYWKQEKIDILGHSHGGAIALAYAERYPDRVRRLVLVGGQMIGYSSSAESKAIGEAQKRDPAFASAYAGPSRPQDNDDQLTAEFRRTFIVYLHNPQRDARAVEKTLPDTMVSSSLGAEQIVEGTPQLHQVEDLPRVKAATLVIVGRYDIACPPGVSRKMHEGIAGSRMKVLEDSGHFPWAEEPGAFFSSVTAFLSE